jgi:hypothetical protein
MGQLFAIKLPAVSKVQDIIGICANSGGFIQISARKMPYFSTNFEYAFVFTR